MKETNNYGSIFNTIGKIMYCRDNSYIRNITNPDNCIMLAGNWEKLALPIAVISEPFKLKVITIVGRESEMEFVTVVYDNDIYVVLNDLSQTQKVLRDQSEYEDYPQNMLLGY